MASLVQNNNEHSLTSPEQKCTGELARLRVTKVRRFQEPRTADFGKSRENSLELIELSSINKVSLV
jgi:hypothetical protein